MKSPLPLVAILLALAGCAPTTAPASLPPIPQDDLNRTGIGRIVTVGGPKVTPLRVLEDSRCPAEVACVWAGRVRIIVRVDLGRGSEMHELTQGTPVPVADGTLELVEVQPAKPSSEQEALSPRDYRFGFRFMGGL
jgi:hypothetical protein